MVRENKHIPELCGFMGTLEELKIIVASLISEYGKNAILEIEAGPKNISAVLLQQTYSEAIK